jgi:hypothetical protein
MKIRFFVRGYENMIDMGVYWILSFLDRPGWVNRSVFVPGHMA